MVDVALDFRQNASPRFSVTSLLGVVGAHVAVLAALISLDVVPNPLQMQPLMVQLVSEPEPVKVQPPRPPTPAKTPRPSAPVKQPVAAPTLAAQTEAPSADVAPAKPAVEAPARPAPAEAAVSQPRFDANYLDNPAPAYPPISRRMGEEGRVFLRVLVETDGRPSRVEIRTSSGSQRLDQAAEQAVWRWKFVPAKRGSETVSAWVVVPISFSLKG